MTGEEKCNRCEQFGPNGLTDYPCKRIPSRNCPWFKERSLKDFTFLVMVLWLSITNLQTMEALKMTIALVKST